MKSDLKPLPDTNFYMLLIDEIAMCRKSFLQLYNTAFNQPQIAMILVYLASFTSVVVRKILQLKVGLTTK